MGKNNKVDNSNYPKQSERDSQFSNQDEYIDTGRQQSLDQHERDMEEQVNNEAQDSQSGNEQQISESKRKPSEKDYVDNIRPNMKR